MRQAMLPGLFGLLLATAGSAAAQDAAEEKKLGWAGSAELALVNASGNSEASTFSLRGDLTRTWADSLLKFEAGALRAEQTTVERRAVVGPLGEVTVFEVEDTETSAENYLLRGQYDRNITERFFAFGGAGWERNEPTGIEDRYYVVAGVGNVWADTEAYENRTGYGLAYNREEETSGNEEDFLSLRLTWNFLRKLTATTTFTNDLIADENLDETSDYRLENLSSLAVAMSERLALKVSLQLVYDNEPAFVAVPIEFLNGDPTGESVPVQLEELDTILSAALVVSF